MAATWPGAGSRTARRAAQQILSRRLPGSLASWYGTASEAQDPPSAWARAADPAAQPGTREGRPQSLSCVSRACFEASEKGLKVGL